MPPLRIVFFGTAPLACESLRAVASSPDVQLLAAVTQPDRPGGRHLKLLPSPVKALAVTLQLPVLQPEKARDPTFVAELASLRPDLIVVAAYGQILPRSILDLPNYGCLNVHASLLPKYRGAAPIQQAILDDEAKTGITIMKMDEGLDTGGILTQEATAITDEDDAPSLHDRLARIGADLLVRTIPDYVGGRIVPRQQPEDGASYARKIVKEDGRLDWALPARTLWNRIRAFTPWPGAFTFLPGGSQAVVLKVWRATVAENVLGCPGEIIEARKSSLIIASGLGGLSVSSLQLEGGKRLGTEQFLAGHGLKRGDRVG
jgi:methionyl-tRNA formyltransferase